MEKGISKKNEFENFQTRVDELGKIAFPTIGTRKLDYYIHEFYSSLMSEYHKTQNVLFLCMANHVNRYLFITSNSELINKSKLSIQLLKENINSVLIVQGRIKSFQKYVKKGLLYLRDIFVYNKQKALSSINDVLGLRLVIENYEENIDVLEHLYKTHTKALNIMMREMGILPLSKESRNNSGWKKPENSIDNLVIPTADQTKLWLGFYFANVKDYYLHPKDNGYQGLHTSLLDGYEMLVFLASSFVRNGEALNPTLLNSLNEKQLECINFWCSKLSIFNDHLEHDLSRYEGIFFLDDYSSIIEGLFVCRTI